MDYASNSTPRQKTEGKTELKVMKLIEHMKDLPHKNIPRETSNPQTLWKVLKEEFVNNAKTAANETHNRMLAHKRKMQKDLKDVENDWNLNGSDNQRINKAYLAEELGHLEKKDMHNQKEYYKAKLLDHRERLDGMWSALSKERKPRDLIQHLKIPSTMPSKPEYNTKQMAQPARDYHEKIQHEENITYVYNQRTS